MPIHMLLNSTAGDILSEYYTHLAVGLVSAFFIRSWAMGPSNTRERDLHGRTVMMTGAFTPIGITVMTKLAERGAQIIALEPTISTQIMELAFVIRSTTSNDHIFVEECDITSPKSMKAFTSQFVKLTKGTGGAMEPPRVDALLFAHEYSHIGLFRSSKEKTRMDEDSLRRRRGLGTFFFINQMLPFLLKLPSDRDIRIINIVNPLYATATPTFDPLETPGTNNQKSVSIEEGRRSLRSIIFARHLQRVLDALGSSTPTSAPLPNPDEMAKDTIPKKPSNITSIVVTPGFTRAETIVPFFGASTRCPQFSALGAIIYILILPFLFLFAKSASAASQTPLYALFLPTQSKTLSKDEKIVEGGKLYRDCTKVMLPGKGEALVGDEKVGRAVWEAFERDVKELEEEEKRVTEKDEKKKQAEGDKGIGKEKEGDSSMSKQSDPSSKKSKAE